MRLHKQPYLVNPFRQSNPYEIFTVPKRIMAYEVGSDGKFIRGTKIKSERKEKSKTISKKEFGKLFKKLKVEKKKKVSKKIKKSSKKKLVKKVKKSSKNFIRKNPILTINPIRRVAMKRKYRKNPIIAKQQISEVKDIVISSAVVAGGIVIGKISSDFLASKVKFLSNPYAKIAGNIAIGSAVYLLGRNIKAIPQRYVSLLAIGMIAPSLVELLDMMKGKKAKVGEIGYVNDYEDTTSNEVGYDYENSATSNEVGDEDTDTEAYLPETEAYVPETGAYVSENEYGV